MSGENEEKEEGLVDLLESDSEGEYPELNSQVAEDSNEGMGEGENRNGAIVEVIGSVQNDEPTLESLSLENQNKVTELSELLGGVDRKITLSTLQNDYDVQGAANSYFSGSDQIVDDPIVMEEDSDDLDSEYENHSNDNEEKEKSSKSSKSKTFEEYVRHFGRPIGFGTYSHRRFYDDDEEGDSPIEIQQDEDYFVNTLSETDVERETFTFHYSLRHRLCKHPKYVEDKIYKHSGMALKGAVFNDIKIFIMSEFGIDMASPECLVCETRLWLTYLGSPFIVLSDVSTEFVSNFEKRTRCTIDGLCFMLECRIAGEKYLLDKLIDCRSSWKFTTLCLQDPRYVGWRGLKMRKYVVQKDEKESRERIGFMVLECTCSEDRVVDIGIVSKRRKISFPKFLAM